MSLSGSRDYFASALTRIVRRIGDDGVLRPTLDQARVTEMRAFDNFARLAEFVLCDLRYPYEQDHKFDTYGWVPALYDTSVRTFDGGGSSQGLWRNGAAEADLLSCLIMDVDNDNDNDNDAQPMLTPDEFAARMGGTGPVGPGWFTYTSFLSRPEHPKFRAVTDTSRALTRAESACVFRWLNLHALNQQGDSSIYDPGDYLYAPPCNTARQVGGDGPLDVDAILAEVAADPARYGPAQATKPQRAPARPLTPDEAARLAEQMAVLTAAEGVGIDNPAVFNPAWIDDYRHCTGSHWETMRSILGRVWRRTGEALRLDWRHVDGERGAIIVEHAGRQDGPSTKTRKSRRVAMRPVVRERLTAIWKQRGCPEHGTVFLNKLGKRYADARLVGGNPLTSAHRTACRKPGIAGFRIHDWRHHWVVWFLKRGGNLRAACQLAGWSSLRMLQRYAVFEQSDLDEVMIRTVAATDRAA